MWCNKIIFRKVLKGVIVFLILYVSTRITGLLLDYFFCFNSHFRFSNFGFSCNCIYIGVKLQKSGIAVHVGPPSAELAVYHNGSYQCYID